jgi:hypothetical protein
MITHTGALPLKVLAARARIMLRVQRRRELRT